MFAGATDLYGGMGVQRLNHAVLYVRDVEISKEFYGAVLGFRTVSEFPGAAFLQAPDSTNDHDLGVFQIGAAAGPDDAGRSTVGMYHLAWEVDTLGELQRLAGDLRERGARKPEARALFVRLLMEIALANGSVHQRERTVLWKVCTELDIGRVELAQLEAMLRAQRGFRRSVAGDADARRQAAEVAQRRRRRSARDLSRFRFQRVRRPPRPRRHHLSCPRQPR